MIPFTQPGSWPEGISPSRFASRIRREPKGCEVALIGLADDLGVRLNHGRPGARQGPAAFRAALARYGVAGPHGWEWPEIFDAGDIVPAAGDTEASLHETHKRVTDAVAAVLDLGLFPTGIGGGHDLTFPFVRAVTQRFPGLGGLYFDAHLDVRETVGSGMPFRKLIEECGVRRLDLFGNNELVNSREHVEWFLSHGGHMHAGEFAEEQWQDQLPPGELFVSLDLDVLDAAHAPGVSALNPAGWSPWYLETWMSVAGASPRVHCFDIMELNPEFDIDGRTARVATHMFLTFLQGFAGRADRRISS